MARLLIRAVDKVHIDPDLSDKMPKAGHVIAMMPDGHKWGTAEGPPNYVRLDIPGVSVSACSKFFEPVYDPDDLIALNPLPRKIGFRRYEIDIAQIASIEDDLGNELTSAAARLSALDSIVTDLAIGT